MKNTKTLYIIFALSLSAIITSSIVVPLVLKNSKEENPSFDLTLIKKKLIEAQKATNLNNAKKLIEEMYKNDTKLELLEKSKKAANVLGEFIYNNKNSKIFNIISFKTENKNQMLLLVINSKTPSESSISFKQVEFVNQIYQYKQFNEKDIKIKSKLGLEEIKVPKYINDKIINSELSIIFGINQKTIYFQKTFSKESSNNEDYFKFNAVDFL